MDPNGLFLRLNVKVFKRKFWFLQDWSKIAKKLRFLRKNGGLLICLKRNGFAVLFFATTQKMGNLACFGR